MSPEEQQYIDYIGSGRFDLAQVRRFADFSIATGDLLADMDVDNLKDCLDLHTRALAGLNEEDKFAASHFMKAIGRHIVAYRQLEQEIADLQPAARRTLSSSRGLLLTPPPGVPIKSNGVIIAICHPQ